MVNVIVDLNNLFHRWAHFLAYKTSGFLELEEHKAELVQNVMWSLFQDIGRYDKHLKRVILAVDSDKSSWRKNIDFGEQADYKSTRKREYKFNKLRFYQCMEEFVEIMDKKGIIVMKADHIEADDFIAIAAGVLYHKDESVIIVTSDSDLRQIIRSEGEKFIYLYDSDKDKRYHCIDQELKIKGDDIESETIDVGGGDEDEFGGIFETSVEDLGVKTTSMKSLLNDIYHNSEIVNPFEVIFKKMLAGDKGDAVPSCYYYRRIKKDGEPYKNTTSFTDNRAMSVYHKFKKVVTNMDSMSFYRTIYKSESWRKKIAEFVMKEVEIPIDDKTITEIAENIKRNLKATFLNTTVYDDDIKSTIIEEVKKKLFSESSNTNHNEAIKNGFQYELLQDTPYEMGNSNAKDWDDKSYRY